VGKQAAEIEQALSAGILMFNVVSLGELERLSAIAARMARRPGEPSHQSDVDPKTHPYISPG
jgi:diaminopimelate decarboxylase